MRLTGDVVLYGRPTFFDVDVELAPSETSGYFVAPPDKVVRIETYRLVLSDGRSGEVHVNRIGNAGASEVGHFTVLEKWTRS